MIPGLTMHDEAARCEAAVKALIEISDARCLNRMDIARATLKALGVDISRAVSLDRPMPKERCDHPFHGLAAGKPEASAARGD